MGDRLKSVPGVMKKRFFKLALINILSTLTVPLVGLVDTAMLGHLPDIRFLAGVALASLLFDFLYWTLRSPHHPRTPKPAAMRRASVARR